MPWVFVRTPESVDAFTTDQVLAGGIKLHKLERVGRFDVIAARLLDLGEADPFLPGEREIRDAHAALNRRKYRNTEVIPLYARLSARDQDRVFQPGPQRRIVLATNVAETSLTVPRIRYVIDPGLAREIVGVLILGAVGGASSLFSMGQRWLIQESVSMRAVSGSDKAGPVFPSSRGGAYRERAAFQYMGRAITYGDFVELPSRSERTTCVSNPGLTWRPRRSSW